MDESDAVTGIEVDTIRTGELSPVNLVSSIASKQSFILDIIGKVHHRKLLTINM